MAQYLILVNVSTQDDNIESYQYTVSIGPDDNILGELEKVKKTAVIDYKKNHDLFQQECFVAIHQVVLLSPPTY